MRALCFFGIAVLVGTSGCSAAFPASAHGAEIPVTVQTDDPHVRLENFERRVPGRRGGYERYGTLCTGPCTTVVHDWTRFRINGDGIPASSTFYLQAGAPVVLRVHEGSEFANTTGMLLSFVAGGVLVDTTILAVASPDLRQGATVAAESSAVAVAVGILLWVFSRTTVDADPPSAILR
jgi:hypothetical protein